jgi:hypothetical protein
VICPAGEAPHLSYYLLQITLILSRTLSAPASAIRSSSPGSGLAVRMSTFRRGLASRRTPMSSVPSPGAVADVEQYLLLGHRALHLSLPPASRDRFAEQRVRRITQMRDLFLVHSA